MNEPNPYRELRLFKLVRHEDVTGVSGTGVVGEGVQFSDGRCVMRWTTQLSSIALYDSIQDVLCIHGHDGNTAVVFARRTDPDKEWRDL